MLPLRDVSREPCLLILIFARLRHIYFPPRPGPFLLGFPMLVLHTALTRVSILIFLFAVRLISAGQSRVFVNIVLLLTAH